MDELKKSLELALYGDDEFLLAVKDIEFARAAYDTLCNTEWVDADFERWSCTMRYAGGIIATARDQGEDYVEFYLGDSEDSDAARTHSRTFRKMLSRLGWRLMTVEDEIKDTRLLIDRLIEAERHEAAATPSWFESIAARLGPGDKSLTGRVYAAAANGQVTEERYRWMIRRSMPSEEAMRSLSA